MGYFDSVLKREDNAAPPRLEVVTDPATSSSYGAAALRSEVASVANAPEGTRNDALNRAAFRMGRHVGAGSIDAATVRAALADAGRAAGLPQHEIDLILRDDTTGGINNGALVPRHPAPRDEAPTVTVLDNGDVKANPSPDGSEGEVKLRRVVLTAASTIKPRRVKWLWKKRIALGTLSLLAGREGLGKSTLAYWIAARITRGELFGEYERRARGVLVCATEDSWEHTIVPRLMAAGADLDRVFRVDVLSHDDIHLGLSLPRDLLAVEDAAQQAEAALLLLDPLMSRLGDLDTHRDAEVRQALEPLAALADRCAMAVLGLIHHNKSGSSDPLQLVMGSKAFTAVARSVHTVVPDPDDPEGQRRLFGTPKNNLGPTDLPTFTFTIGSHCIPTDEGDAWTGALMWGQELDEAIDEVMARTADEGGSTSECALWVKSYLEAQGGTAERGALFAAAKAQHFSESAMNRAGKKLRIAYKRHGFGGGTFWSLPGTLPTLDDEEAS